ncbi:MAG: aldose 1-epimerase family protein [Clostridia bacterium]|nr:aldose 1-epimerase family protein [Clostridia bacterium]
MRYWNYKNLDLNKIGDMAQVAGLRRYEFTEGKAKGVEAVEIHTGSGLELTVLPGRGMDIAWISYRGIPISYLSKTGVVSPAYYESNGMNWLHNFFAGGLTTCGLLNVGGPEEVEHPVIGKRSYGLHGRISNAAAEQVSLFEDYVDGEYQMKVSGVVKEGVLHGESLTLRREIETAFGKSEFTIRDTVTNRGAKDQDIMLLYHINLGYPLLDEGARVECDAKEIIGQSEEAIAELSDALKMTNPVQDIAERCYAVDLNPDHDGNVSVKLVNDNLGLGVQLSYQKEQLPFLNEWKMLNTKEYVVGLEPCTALPQGTQKAKETGSIITLAPGESRVFEITYKILDQGEE